MTHYKTSLGSVTSTATAVAAIATDPYLPQVSNLIIKLRDIERSKAGRSTGSTGKGIGLRNVVGPLRAFVTVQEKPWILPAAVAGIFGAIFIAGYYTRKASE